MNLVPERFRIIMVSYSLYVNRDPINRWFIMDNSIYKQMISQSQRVLKPSPVHRKSFQLTAIVVQCSPGVGNTTRTGWTMCEKPSQLACPVETAKVHGWCIVGAWVVVVVVVVPRLFDRGKHRTELRMAFLDPTWLCILTSVRFRSAMKWRVSRNGKATKSSVGHL